MNFRAAVFASSVVTACALACGLPLAALADAPAHYITQSPVFADIAWGSDPETVKAALLAKGYVVDVAKTAHDTDHDLWFDGTLQGQDASIIELFDRQHHLLKTAVILLTSDADCKKIYDVVLAGLTEKYGAPTVDATVYPNAAGTEFVTTMQSGNAKLENTWLGQGTKPFALDTRVEKNLTVGIYYESDKWSDEADRRAARPDKDL